LISANAFWANTGYAIPARALIPRLRKLGHEVAQFAWYGLQGAKIVANDITIYPAVMDRTAEAGFGSNVIGEHVAYFEADLMLSIHDIWVLPNDYARRMRSRRTQCRWMAWYPVDHEPPPPRVIEIAKTVDYRFSYSRWGAEQMDRAGVPTGYLPLGVDTAVYTPRPQSDARQALGWPQEGFIAASVAANKSNPARKAYPEAMQAFAGFCQTRPDARWYIHCDWTEAEGGVDILAIADSLGIKDRLLVVDRYREALGLPEEYLANVYSAADVLLGPSRSEGFGLPLLEAQACGCPVITTAFASMPELTWNGVCVPVLQREWTPLRSWEAVPSVGGIAAALEEIAGWDETQRAVESARGIMRAREFDWDRLVERYWKPLLEEMADPHPSPLPEGRGG
jgi:glycosyltransferase involved in cell wall biosynthesis